MTEIESKLSSSNINCAWVLDDDDVMLQLVSNFLESFGIDEVRSFSDGDEVWQAFQNGEPCDLLVLDWKLKGLSGLGLFNRFRGDSRYEYLPILVISGLLRRDDFALLDEFPCSALLEKPFTKKVIEPTIVGLVEERNWYIQNSSTVASILSRGQLGSDERSELAKLIQSSSNPIPIVVMAARRMRENDQVEEARHIVELALKRSPGNVALMGEMARILFVLGKLRESKEVLNIANRLSPDNLKRLCFTGQVELNLNNPAKAREMFRQALAVDPDSTEARQGEKLTGDLMEESEESVNTENDAGYKIASMLNIMAIAKVRSGDLQGGIEQYKAALAILSGSDHASKLCFNLGLGYMRKKSHEMALDWFRKCVDYSEGMNTKASSYVGKLEKICTQNSNSLEPGFDPADTGEGPSDDLDFASEGTADFADVEKQFLEALETDPAEMDKKPESTEKSTDIGDSETDDFFEDDWDEVISAA